MTSPFWNMNLGRATPDQRVVLDGREVKLSGRRHAIPKCGAVSIQGIGCYPEKRQFASWEGAFQHFQPDFRLRFEFQIFRNSTGFPLLCVFCCKPFFRHEQSAFDQTIAFATGVAQIHANLPVRNLAHRAAILRRHPDRFRALFDRTPFIDQHHPSAKIFFFCFIYIYIYIYINGTHTNCRFHPDLVTGRRTDAHADAGSSTWRLADVSPARAEYAGCLLVSACPPITLVRLLASIFYTGSCHFNLVHHI